MTNMKVEENIGESEDKCDEWQLTARRLRKKAAEKADLKIKHCHWKFWIYYFFYDIVSALVEECSVCYSLATALSHVSL